jgi:ankyrin repeat protein
MQHAMSAEDYQEHVEDVLKIATGLALSGYGEAVGQMTGMARAFRADAPLWAVHKAHRGPRGRTRLMYAALKGDVERARFLVERGAAVNDSSGWGTVLMHASSYGHLETVRCLLVQGGADVNLARTVDGWTPLMLAATMGHLDIVRLLLEHGADRQLLSHSGRTAHSFALMHPLVQLALA